MMTSRRPRDKVDATIVVPSNTDSRSVQGRREKGRASSPWGSPRILQQRRTLPTALLLPLVGLLVLLPTLRNLMFLRRLLLLLRILVGELHNKGVQLVQWLRHRHRFLMRPTSFSNLCAWLLCMLRKSRRVEAMRVRETVGEGKTEVLERELWFHKCVLGRANAPRKGLLDRGATHPLRTACEEEWNSARPITVEMAVGRQDLRANAVGTILTREYITPICPLGLLVERLGCRVDWAAGRYRVEHPLRGLLNTELEGNCPVVSESLCLELIEELEIFQNDRMQQALALRALNLGAESGSLNLRLCVGKGE